MTKWIISSMSQHSPMSQVDLIHPPNVSLNFNAPFGLQEDRVHYLIAKISCSNDGSLQNAPTSLLVKKKDNNRNDSNQLFFPEGAQV